MASQESNVKQGKHAAVKEAPTESWETPSERHAGPIAAARQPVAYPEYKPNDMGMAYLLLIFGGLFGVHRFYLGRNRSATTMAILMLCLVGIVINPVWVFIDLFLIPDIFKEETNK